MSRPVPLVRAAALAPFILWMRAHGLGWEYRLRAAGVPAIAALEPDRPIALVAGVRFIRDAARAEGPDLSSRVVHSGVDDFHLGAVGLDLHRVYSSEQGDIGTLTLQPYLLRIDSARNAPPLFDDGDDWALQWRIANFNYTGLGHGRFNVRLGHF